MIVPIINIVGGVRRFQQTFPFLFVLSFCWYFITELNKQGLWNDRLFKFNQHWSSQWQKSQWELEKREVCLHLVSNGINSKKEIVACSGYKPVFHFFPSPKILYWERRQLSQESEKIYCLAFISSNLFIMISLWLFKSLLWFIIVHHNFFHTVRNCFMYFWIQA